MLLLCLRARPRARVRYPPLPRRKPPRSSNTRPLRRFEPLQTGFRPRIVGAQAVYGPVERLLAHAKVRGRRLLLLDGSIVVAPLLRDLTLRVPERLPGL